VQFEIDHRFCKYGNPGIGENLYPLAVNELPEVHLHNSQVERAIDFYLKSRPTYAIIDKGRTKDETSCIYIENGKLRGMGYIPTDVAIHSVSDVIDHIELYTSNQYLMKLVSNYAENNSSKIRYDVPK
jgi:DNA polymerase-3 subunit epsilon